ncbi:hypothetical protein TIFTF001_031269 [Ficus carica]|uniref:Uncharacterized protein n=1 Tax=Ficus carica TaxID=3494 RepID=A0AA88J635_FICCA|nr:hypothetical protein TIFTF001_031269 [Ficus carica]
MSRVSPDLAECLALRESSLEFAASNNLKIAIAESSDAVNVVQAVNKRCTLGADGVVIEDFCRLLSALPGGICSHIPLSPN